MSRPIKSMDIARTEMYTRLTAACVQSAEWEDRPRVAGGVQQKTTVAVARVNNTPLNTTNSTVGFFSAAPGFFIFSTDMPVCFQPYRRFRLQLI